MMRSHYVGNTIDKKHPNENKQTMSRLFKKNKKGYLFIKFVHPVSLKKKSYKYTRSIVFDVSI